MKSNWEWEVSFSSETGIHRTVNVFTFSAASAFSQAFRMICGKLDKPLAENTYKMVAVNGIGEIENFPRG